MPFEVLADFKQREGASKIDTFWSGIARSIVMKLIEMEPRIRLRIRNFPPPAVYETGAAALHKSGIALSESDVPELLRDRINIPEGDEYWIHNYKCMTCLNANGNPGLWVPHIRRKLHHDHDLKDLGITAKGIKQPWTTTHRLVIGDEKRIAGMGDMLYSVALTGPGKDISNVKGFDVIFVLPVSKGTHEKYYADLNVLKQQQKIEHWYFIGGAPNYVVKSVLDLLIQIDPKILQSEINTENIEDDAEYKQQLARSKMADRALAGMGLAKTPEQAKAALRGK